MKYKILLTLLIVIISFFSFYKIYGLLENNRRAKKKYSYYERMIECNFLKETCRILVEYKKEKGKYPDNFNLMYLKMDDNMKRIYFHKLCGVKSNYFVSVDQKEAAFIIASEDKEMQHENLEEIKNTIKQRIPEKVHAINRNKSYNAFNVTDVFIYLNENQCYLNCYFSFLEKERFSSEIKTYNFEELSK